MLRNLLDKTAAYFQYEGEADAARKTVKELSAKAETRKGLSGSERRKLDAARRLVAPIQRRRRVVGATALAVLAATSAGVAWELGVFDDPVPGTAGRRVAGERKARLGVHVSSKSPRGLEAEEMTDRLIAKIETGMEAFGALLLPKIDALEDEQWRGELRSPFDIMEMNGSNSDKNGIRFQRVNGVNGEGDVTIQNPYHFFYVANPNLQQGMAAGYVAPYKEMELSPHLDANNLLDMLVVYHELRHAAEDSNIRMNIQSEGQYNAYMQSLTLRRDEAPRLVINLEAGPYAYEIEILDLILDGELRAAIEEKRPVDIADIKHRLNARNDQTGTIEMLVAFAHAYYPERMAGGVLSQRFFDKIAHEYRRKGYDVYIQTTTGVRPY